MAHPPLADLEAPAAGGFVALIAEAARQEAQDLLLVPGWPPTARVHRQLVALHPTALDATEIASFAHIALGADAQAELARWGDTCLTLDDPALGVRVRLSAYRQQDGLALALRLLPRAVPALTTLGLPPSLGELVERAHGLVLLTGPTGSGKSTTLAALIDHLNSTHSQHIVTIEDPIEYRHLPRRSIVDQREVGHHTRTWARALQSVIRQSPDILVVGEARDPDTLGAALTFAETGHLTLTTLHTRGAAASLNRILDLFPAHRQEPLRRQLALGLEAVISHLLLPGTDGRLVLAAEVMIATPAVRTMIRDGRLHELGQAIESGAAAGMISLSHSLATLVGHGRLTLATARAAGADASTLEQLVHLRTPPRRMATP